MCVSPSLEFLILIFFKFIEEMLPNFIQLIATISMARRNRIFFTVEDAAEALLNDDEAGVQEVIIIPPDEVEQVTDKEEEENHIPYDFFT